MRQVHKIQPRRLLSLLLVCLLGASCALPGLAANETAKTVQLMKTEGTVSVSNSSGKKLSVRNSMRLYNGYQIKTEAASYAWFNLDSAKLSKLDEASEMELRKSGKKLELLLNSGNLYFNVTEPLETDETLNIRTSTMVVGIRGTCGWVKVVDQWHSRLYVLEGRVTCSVTDPVTGQTKTTVLTGGEWASFVVYPQDRSGDKCDIIRQQKYTESTVPGFVQTELAGNRALCEKIYSDSGLDLRSLTQSQAQQQLKSDQAAMAAQLNASKEQQSAQESQVSTDPVWPENVNSSQGSSSGSSGGSSSGTTTPPTGITSTTPTTTQVLTMAMPVTIPQIRDALAPANVSEVTVTGSGDLNLTDAFTVEGGKTLTLDNGVNLTVADGAALNVDGTLNINGNLDNYGTITVTSPNSLNVSGYFRNHEMNGVVNNKDSGHIVPAQGIQNEGSITMSGNAVLESGDATATVTMAGANASLGLNGGAISNNGAGNAIRWTNGKPPADDVTGTSTTSLWTTGDAPLATVTDGVETKNPALNGYKVISGSGQTSLRPTGGVEGGVLTYIVNFDANGGRWRETAPITSITVEQNTALGTPPNPPERTGYSFSGWKDAGGTAYDVNTMKVTSNLTLYAQWTANSGTETPGKVTITFDPNGGTLSTSSSVVINAGGSLPYLPAAPTRKGYTFTEWSGLQNTYSANTTLTAQWKLNTDVEMEMVHIAFRYNHPKLDSTEFDIPKGQPLNYSPQWPQDEVNGYCFLGWNTKQDGTGNYYGRYYDPANDIGGGTDGDWTKPVETDLELYGIWEPVKTEELVTLTFMAEGNECGTVQIAKDSGLSYPPAEPDYQKEGYLSTFKGWYYDDGNGEPQRLYANSTFSEDTTVYASYIHYPLVTFDLYGESDDRLIGGGEWVNNWDSRLQLPTRARLAPSALDDGDDGDDGDITSSFRLSSVPLEPTKEGYQFLGWRLAMTVEADDTALSLVDYTSDQLWTVAFKEPTTLVPVWKPDVVVSTELTVGEDATVENIKASLAVNDEVTILRGPKDGAEGSTLIIDDWLTIPVGKDLILGEGVNMEVNSVLLNGGFICADGGADDVDYDWPTITVKRGDESGSGAVLLNISPYGSEEDFDGTIKVGSITVGDGTVVNFGFITAQTPDGLSITPGGRVYNYCSLMAGKIDCRSMLYNSGLICGDVVATDASVRMTGNAVIEGSYTQNDTDLFEDAGISVTGSLSVSGDITLNSGSMTVNGDLSYPGDYNNQKVLVQGGELTIDGGMISYPIEQAGGTVTINGGELRGGYTFSGGKLDVTGGRFNDENGYGIQIADSVSEKPQITLSGGEFQGCVMHVPATDPNMAYLRSTKELKDFLEGSYIVHADYMNGYYILPPAPVS